MSKRSKQRRQKGVIDDTRTAEAVAVESQPDWDGRCEVCGASPVVPESGMCGPCTFGEADTAGGNW